MRRYRKILRISYKGRYQRGNPCQDPAGNWTTRIPPDHCKEMQTEVVWTCLQFIRSGQTILQGTVKRGRRQARQKKWEDSIREWTGLEFAKSPRAVENTEKWRKLVVKSSVVPQWPLQGIDDDDDNDESIVVKKNTHCSYRWVKLDNDMDVITIWTTSACNKLIMMQ